MFAIFVPNLLYSSNLRPGEFHPVQAVSKFWAFFGRAYLHPVITVLMISQRNVYHHVIFPSSREICPYGVRIDNLLSMSRSSLGGGSLPARNRRTEPAPTGLPRRAHFSGTVPEKRGLGE